MTCKTDIGRYLDFTVLSLSLTIGGILATFHEGYFWELASFNGCVKQER